MLVELTSSLAVRKAGQVSVSPPPYLELWCERHYIDVSSSDVHCIQSCNYSYKIETEHLFRLVASCE